MDQTTEATVAVPISMEAVEDMRRRIAAGETVTNDELREAVSFLREDRISAGAIKPKKKAKSEPIDIASLFAAAKPST